MDIFKRNQFKFRSLPRRLTSIIESISFDKRNYLSNTPTIPRRRNGISITSYNDSKKSLLDFPLPTTVLQGYPTKEYILNNIDFPIASSSYYILTLINQCSTLILFNKDCELYRLDLSDRLIYVYDICWSLKLNLFILCGYSLYTFNPILFQFSIIDKIEFNRGEWIISITSDNNSIYLLYSSRSCRIERRSLFLPYFIEKKIFPKEFLKEKDFFAQCIRINQCNIIALTIKQTNGHWRVDLFNSKNFHRIHRGCSLGESIRGMKNCLILPYEHLWIIINNCSLSEQIILIDQNGKIKSKTKLNQSFEFINLCLIGNQWIGMNSKNKLQFYKIQ